MAIDFGRMFRNVATGYLGAKIANTEANDKMNANIIEQAGLHFYNEELPEYHEREKERKKTYSKVSSRYGKDVANYMDQGGFTDGKWTPDVAFIIAEPVMKLIATVGMLGGVKKFRISIDDMTNKNELSSIMNIKSKKEEFSKAAKSIAEDKPKIEQKGLMAAPQPAQEEMI